MRSLSVTRWLELLSEIEAVRPAAYKINGTGRVLVNGRAIALVCDWRMQGPAAVRGFVCVYTDEEVKNG